MTVTNGAQTGSKPICAICELWVRRFYS